MSEENPYNAIAFTQEVIALQTAAGSRAAYARQGPRPGGNNALREINIQFIRERDGFYLASVSQTGWPYVQFRGGPPGFVHADAHSISWADFRGNQQLLTAGYVKGNDRVSLFFMDYAGKRRLKVYGHLKFTDATVVPHLAERLAVPGYAARVDRVAQVTIAAWDYNCPQHIPDRLTHVEWEMRDL